jgi:transmembrane sensor
MNLISANNNRSIILPSADAQQSAAEWFVVLTSGTTTDSERANWQRWREQHAEHEQAWQQIEAVTQKFSHMGLSPASGMKLLTHLPSQSRRNTIKQLLLLMAVGSGGIAGYRQLPEWSADYQTAKGEKREWILADGSHLTLNSNTAVDIAFDNKLRRIILQRGEILIETAHEKHRNYRPLIAETEHGKITALGTRFNIYRMFDKTRVNLYEGRLDILTRSNQQLRLDAGQEIDFTADTITLPLTVATKTPYWINNVLVADNMPLLEFIAEIARYRSGYLRADSELASLRISGAFPLADTDAILHSLTITLPVKIHSITGYWVTLKPSN